MKLGKIFDRPRQTDKTPVLPTMTTNVTWLAALGSRLTAVGLAVEAGPGGLIVRNLDTPSLADTIKCRRRPDDGDRFWFFTSWNEAIAQVEELDEAVLTVVGYLKYDIPAVRNK
ncbi:hypothetical protein [Actinomadura sp. 6N118]|uniref:hypothetical protein n=1 Tax=Actinomadura sp. 6N118 TaxID=3375151 RepID=UPI0037A438E5